MEMDINILKNNLANSGWQNIASGTKAYVSFDLIGHRSTRIKRQWFVLVQFIDQLEAQSAIVCQANFESVKEKSKPTLFKSGFPFVYCLVAKNVLPEGLKQIRGDEFSFASNAIGAILVCDTVNKVVHGTVPRLPFDANQIIQSVKDVLYQSLG